MHGEPRAISRFEPELLTEEGEPLKGPVNQSFWPTTTQRALLEVVLGTVDRAATRWEQLQPLDVEALERGSFAMLPLLYERLREVAPDDPQLPRLLGTYRNVWYRNQLLLDRLGVLLPLLRKRAHVEPLLVSGLSAALRWYPRLGLRPVAQLELIVERQAAKDAVQVAGYAGWGATGRERVRTRLRDKSGRVLVLHHGVPAALAAPLGDQGIHHLRERSLELDAVDGAPLVMDPTDELILLCATGARTTHPPTCQWLIDVHHLLRSQRLPAEELAQRAAGFHLAEPLRATLAYLAGLRGEDELGEHLAALDAHPASRRDRFAFRLSGVGGRFSVAPAQVLAAHLQATGDESLVRVITLLPRSLQETWGASSPFEVPVLAARKTARLFTRPAQASAAERSRSASS
jgi:putative nucleotidyltransferase-like protein